MESSTAESSSALSNPTTRKTLTSFPRCYVWTCHRCMNINIVDVQNNEPGYVGIFCENERCKHKRCIKCSSTDSTDSAATTYDMLPVRTGVRRYNCAFHIILNCPRIYSSWLDAERCARMHYTASTFVPCTVSPCRRRFASLDHFREHLQTHEEAATATPPLPPAEYTVLFCPFRAMTRCIQLSYSLEELQQHFLVHLASGWNQPPVHYVQECTRRADGRYPCRYGAVLDCDMTFATAPPEKVHLIRHFPRLLPCPLCEKEFRLPEWMAYHLNRHATAVKGIIGEVD